MAKQSSPWLFCAACTVLLFCTVGLSTSCFSIYQPYLISVIGLSNAQSSLFLTVRTLSGLISTFLMAEYLRRLGLARGIVIAGLATAAGFLILSLANSFAAACVTALLFGAGYGFAGTVAVSMIIHRVFTEHMGLALSICAAGTGVSTIICPPIATWMIENHSLRLSLIAESIFILVCVLAVALVLRRLSPEQRTGTGGRKSAGNSHLSTGCILSLAAMLFLGTIANAGWSHLSVLYKTAGFTPSQIALLISFVGAALTVGKLVFGECADLIGAKFTFRIACAMMTLGVLLCCFVERRSMTTAFISMLLLGLSLPMSTIGPGLLGQTFSASVDFDSFVRLLQLAYMIGTLLYTPVPGILADISGSYVPAFRILTVFALITSALMVLAYRGKES